MQYYSLNRKAPEVSFKEALIGGLAPDKGLYFPKKISPLPKSFFDTIESLENDEIAFKVIEQFVGDEIPKQELQQIVSEVLNFDFPVKSIEENVSVLELYHGPTMAFKDVGARFMARCLAYFNRNKNEKQDVTVLVATSGDTGGAVANGFLGVEGVEVVILYPSGKVSDIQEKQLTTLGENVVALEVEGTFDHCQAMVKEAFLDEDIKRARSLTSANSINIARWLPQMFYFFFAYKQLKSIEKELAFSVPSGNYGNICAGVMAKRLGLPIHHLIAGTNANDIIPNYLETGNYVTKPSVPTISNAMDVGAPSNFIRIEELYENDLDRLRTHLSGYSFSDEETTEAIHHLYETKHYVADPHGAIGYLALKEYLRKNNNIHGVFLETAHPIKFLDVIPKNIAQIINMPPQIEAVIGKEKRAIRIENYKELKDFLLA